MRRRGFTLIELLVVIAIIALLIGIIVPSLGAARRAAQSTVCLANQRSLGQGFALYLNDYQALPPLRLPSGEVHASSGRPRARWHFLVGDYVGQPFFPREGEADGFYGIGGSASDDVPRLDNEVFRCPLHDLEDYRSKKTGNLMALRNGSYGYNYHYLGNSRDNDGKPMNYPVSDAKILRPYDTIATADSLGNQNLVRDYGLREHAYTMDPPRLDTENNGATGFAQDDGNSPADARHNSKANVAFLDGHAQPLGLVELGYRPLDRSTGEVEHDFGDNGLWNGLGFDSEADH